MPDDVRRYSSSPLPLPFVQSSILPQSPLGFSPTKEYAEVLSLDSHPSIANGPVIFTPKIAGLAHPPAKRRRAKRTEEERIEYLRSDPYVKQFEAYRVLCVTCDKWIRLRQNSTYCSTPWDAHRKGCLAKKINDKTVYALEERYTLFSDDPLVCKFDSERLLCNICVKWVSLPPDDHQAVQIWTQHRAVCQRSAAASSSTIQGTQNDASRTLDNQLPNRAVALPSTSSALHVGVPRHPSLSSSTKPGSPFHVLTPSNYGTTHETRNCDAELRAANLREGPRLTDRIFCKACPNWMELCQGCANPSRQEARHFRFTSNHDLAPASIPGSEEVESAKDVESGRGRKRQIKPRADQRQIPTHPYGSPSYSGFGDYAQQSQPYQHRKSRGAPTLYDLPEAPHTYPGGIMSQIIHTQPEILSAPRTSNQVADHDEGPTTTKFSEPTTRTIRPGSRGSSSSFFKDIDNVRISRATFNINVFPQNSSHEDGPSHTGWRSPRRGGERTITRQTLQPPFHDAITRMPSPILNNDQRHVTQGYTASRDPTAIVDAFDRHPFDVPFTPVTYGIDTIYPQYLPDPDIDRQVGPSDDDQQKRQRRRRKKRVLS